MYFIMTNKLNRNKILKENTNLVRYSGYNIIE